MDGANYGVLHFENPIDFAKPLTPDEEIQQALIALGANVPVPPVADWARIKDCTRHGEGFSFDAETPALHVSLRFDPTASPLGDYNIRWVTQHRKETGRVIRAAPIQDSELYMRQYQPLRQHPLRYIVVTSDPHGTLRVWLIGIHSVRSPALVESDNVAEQT
jgi:hypothetical protein